MVNGEMEILGRTINKGSFSRISFVSALVLSLLLAGTLTCSAAGKSQPKWEDYATVESMVNGVPVYSFSNIMYVYGQSPDLYPGIVMQEGNTSPTVKLKLKKSWEIKHNYSGAEHEMTRRSPLNDSQPLLPIHLIDGDPNTVWCSWGCAGSDGRTEWIRIDLPVETEVASIALVCAPNFPYPVFGKALPKDVEIQVSKDAWHWETVYANKDVDTDKITTLKAEFKPIRAKQIWIKANNLGGKLEYSGSSMYIFSIGEVEVGDTAGNNLALVSRGAGVTVSSTSYGYLNDRYTQDSLWNTLQYDLGNKWVRVGNDNGSFVWAFVEHERGKLQIDPVADESITDCVKCGVNVIMNLPKFGNYIYQNPPRKTNWVEARFREFNDNYNDSPGLAIDTPEMMAGYLRYVEYMVKHFKDRVAYFEIGNEMNGLSSEVYVKQYFEPVYAVIKKAAPDAKIMLCNPAGLDKDWILACLGKQPASGGPNPIKPGIGAKIDGIGWHTMDNPNADYFNSVREFKKECEALGFNGKYFATEIYSGASYPPGPSAWTSEEGMAKYMTQSLVLHGALDMEAGPCHPHFTSYPHPQSLSRWTWPSQIIHPCQPSMTYYMWRNIGTVMDDFYPVEFPVKLTSDKELISVTFRQGDKESMVAAWINGSQSDGIVESKADITLPGMKAKKAWVVDIMNGTEQELNFSVQGDGTVIKGMLIKDYPVFIRLAQK